MRLRLPWLATEEPGGRGRAANRLCHCALCFVGRRVVRVVLVVLMRRSQCRVTVVELLRCCICLACGRF